MREERFRQFCPITFLNFLEILPQQDAHSACPDDIQELALFLQLIAPGRRHNFKRLRQKAASWHN